MPPKSLDYIAGCGRRTLLHFNCRSLNNKMEELAEIVSAVKPLILCLTETSKRNKNSFKWISTVHYMLSSNENQIQP